MTDRPHLRSFLERSSRLTGFDLATLLGTGLSEIYHDVVQQGLGADGFADLLGSNEVPAPADPPLAPDAELPSLTPAQRLILLWYTGLWDGHLVDVQAYREGLLWRAIDANPPGSRPPGYGTWALEPPLRASLARGLASLLLVVSVLLAGLAGLSSPVLAASDSDLARLQQTNRCSGCDLVAAALAGRDLFGVSISSSDLSGADLSGSLISDARMVQCTLSQANLQDSYLTGSDLSGSRLDGANLRHARLTNSILRSTLLMDAQLAGADLSSADLRQAKLVGADLVGANLAGSRLQKADLSGADLSDVDLRHADLSGAVLEGTRLCGADLMGALLPDGTRSSAPPQAC